MRAIAWKLRLAAALAAVVALSACSKEKPVAADALPAPVRSAIQTRFPGAKVVEAKQETEKGRLLYDVTLDQGGRRVEVEVDPHGAIAQIEAPVALHELPVPAAQALEQRYPQEQVRGIEGKTEIVDGRETLVAYEVRILTADKKAIEVDVTPDGKILGEEPDSKK